MTMNNQPLSLAFNAAVMTLANRCNPGGYDVSPDAPSSLEALTAYIAKHGRMCVSDENSDNTIYGDAEHNFAFRAWHDWCHWHLQAAFNPEGEALVCAYQKGMLLQFGYGTKFHVLIDAEITGQLQYQKYYGSFPSNQLAFTLGYLNGRLDIAALRVDSYVEYNRGHSIGVTAA
jgi:hypothetical protein